MHHCLTSQVFTSILTTRMVLSAEELFALDRMAVDGMGNKKIAETLGVPLRTTKRWLQKLADRTVPLKDTAQNTQRKTRH